MTVHIFLSVNDCLIEYSLCKRDESANSKLTMQSVPCFLQQVKQWVPHLNENTIIAIIGLCQHIST